MNSSSSGGGGGSGGGGLAEQNVGEGSSDTRVVVSGGTERSSTSSAQPSRYESQKRRDWMTFLQYLKNHKPPLNLSRCSGAHVIEFMKYLDQFGKTKVHSLGCPYFGHPNPPAPCTCPLKQAWGSLDALVGRLRAAYEENGGSPESNPFGARAVRIYLRDVRESQAKARGIPYEKKKRKRPTTTTTTMNNASSSSISDHRISGGGGSGGDGGGGEVVSDGVVSLISTSSTTTTTTLALPDTSNTLAPL